MAQPRVLRRRSDLGVLCGCFFYVNGFAADDGGLKVVPGSHLYRDAEIRAESDAELAQGWMAGGRCMRIVVNRLAIEELSVPQGTVVLMWTHAAHGVNPRKEDSDTRWCVVYAYRNPGRESRARWISPSFKKEADQRRRRIDEFVLERKGKRR